MPRWAGTGGKESCSGHQPSPPSTTRARANQAFALRKAAAARPERWPRVLELPLFTDLRQLHAPQHSGRLVRWRAAPKGGTPPAAAVARAQYQRSDGRALVLPWSPHAMVASLHCCFCHPPLPTAVVPTWKDPGCRAQSLAAATSTSWRPPWCARGPLAPLQHHQRRQRFVRRRSWKNCRGAAPTPLMVPQGMASTARWRGCTQCRCTLVQCNQQACHRWQPGC
mmetsp:Transcript_77072/g.249414  ORF Transcript_77072/g.249414 Transcript_77072/m.249414 type:complete len:224 (+) Transcript_77072:41-712(+)